MTISQTDYQRAKEHGICKSTFYKRVIKLGWSIEDAINTPILSQKEITARAAAATPFRQTNKLHFLKEDAK